jgi:hypothetical protein
MSDHGLTEISTPSDHGIDLSLFGGGDFDPSGFTGNLAPTDDTIQKVFDKVDLLAVGGAAAISDPNDGEVHLTPKASSSGAEGTIFYCGDDNAVYVGVE